MESFRWCLIKWRVPAFLNWFVASFSLKCNNTYTLIAQLILSFWFIFLDANDVIYWGNAEHKEDIKNPPFSPPSIYHVMLNIIFQRFQSFFSKHIYFHDKIYLRKEILKAIIMYILFFFYLTSRTLPHIGYSTIVFNDCTVFYCMTLPYLD